MSVDLTKPGGLFGDFFGEQSPTRGADLRVDISISLEEADTGVKREVEYTRDFPCMDCESLGLVPGTTTHCATCDGRSQVREDNGVFIFEKVCVACSGRGKLGTACRTCTGRGKQSRRETVVVDVPPGVTHENILRLGGQGEALAGPENGDLFVAIEVRPKPGIERHGDDLHVTVEVPENASQVQIPSLYGEQTVDVPTDVTSGTTVVVPGCGMQILGKPPQAMPTGASGGAPYREVSVENRGNLVVTFRLREKSWLKRFLKLDRR